MLYSQIKPQYSNLADYVDEEVTTTATPNNKLSPGMYCFVVHFYLFAYLFLLILTFLPALRPISRLKFKFDITSSRLVRETIAEILY